jgi:hypothetical protein
MKVVREHINEKFVEKSDPIEDMGIGIFGKKDFTTTMKAAKFIYEALPAILNKKEIPTGIIQSDIYFLKKEYGDIIMDYCNKYVRINGIQSYSPIDSTHNSLMNAIFKDLEILLKNAGYKK